MFFSTMGMKMIRAGTSVNRCVHHSHKRQRLMDSGLHRNDDGVVIRHIVAGMESGKTQDAISPDSTAFHPGYHSEYLPNPSWSNTIGVRA